MARHSPRHAAPAPTPRHAPTARHRAPHGPRTTLRALRDTWHHALIALDNLHRAHPWLLTLARDLARLLTHTDT